MYDVTSAKVYVSLLGLWGLALSAIWRARAMPCNSKEARTARALAPMRFGSRGGHAKPRFDLIR